jgi:cytochrome c biogenesis protein
MGEHTSDRKANPVWAFFSSVRLTIALLIILAIASIIGTLIPQNEGAVEFAREISPAFFRFLSTLNLFDMYHSMWFRVLIGMLALNLTVCSIERLPAAWRRFATLPRPDRERPFDHLPAGQSLRVRAELGEASERVSALLKSRFRRVQEVDRGDRYFGYGEKGRYAHFGVYLIHASVLLILVGGMIGSIFGFEAYVNIAEGDRVRTATLRKTMKPLDLGFEVQCDKFFVDFYETGAPKEYRSDLTFFVNGEAVNKESARVNHPVRFKGVSFYQSNYGSIPKVRLKISRRASEPNSRVMDVEQGDPIMLPGDEGLFVVTNFSNNFMNRLGPAVHIAVRPVQGKETHFWVVKDQERLRRMLPGPMTQFPSLDPEVFKPYRFVLVDRVGERFYTGLQVNRDPGVPLVWLGCFVMVGGFFVTFFTSHRKFWIRVSPSGKGVRISVAGTTSKNPVGLERELERLMGEMKDRFSEKD